MRAKDERWETDRELSLSSECCQARREIFHDCSCTIPVRVIDFLDSVTSAKKKRKK